MTVNPANRTMRQESPARNIVALLLVATAPLLLTGGGLRAGPQHADVGGAWDLTITGEVYKFDMIAEITQEGTELRGTLRGPNGEHELTGKVEGDRITFSVTIESPEGDFSLEFTGAVEGEGLEGTMAAGGDQYTAPWTGKRREAGAASS